MDDVRDCVSDDSLSATSVSKTPVPEYESPRIVDFGLVFEITKGSSHGSSDANGQGFH